MNDGKPYYHDLVTEAVNTHCYIWNVERYCPDGSVRTLSIMCTEEEYDEIVAGTSLPKTRQGIPYDPDMVYLNKLRDDFLKELEEGIKCP